MDTTVLAVTELPRGLDELAQLASVEGFGMVRRLIDDYVAGTNRFSKTGEDLYVARNGDEVSAVGGINVDPYYNSPSLGRIRHLYVHPSFKRAGVGRLVMERIEKHGEQYFASFQLFTTSQVAGKFYESLSYARVGDRWKVSHAKRVGP